MEACAHCANVKGWLCGPISPSPLRAGPLALEACRALWGSWAQGLCVPHFFDSRKQPSLASMSSPRVPPAPSLSSYRQSQAVVN